ncbi:GIY-YIG nuclease family protein [Shewanella sp. TB7-MNA-CIBAN-0143]|uniref:GIY-YIG nuclease family protein n=1 Tax=unclassified Shewanella TaxID=196818 RepID=UPI003319F122
MIDYGTGKSTFETEELRKALSNFLDSEFEGQKIGNYRYGVYAFFDYEREPIYVGQTSESLRTRIRRHLTNRRTDAVAMSVLDPMEVYEIKIWPILESNVQNIKSVLDAMERKVHDMAILESKFNAILNEKEPPMATVSVDLPESFSGIIVTPEVFAMRSHPDFRIARRAATIAKLSHIISERKVNNGLRNTLLTQVIRLQWLSKTRIEAITQRAVNSIEEQEL